MPGLWPSFGGIIPGDVVPDRVEVESQQFLSFLVVNVKVVTGVVTGESASVSFNNPIRRGRKDARKELEERPDLHFLMPLKRNDVRNANNGMLSFEGVLSGVDDHVLYKKRPI